MVAHIFSFSLHRVSRKKMLLLILLYRQKIQDTKRLRTQFTTQAVNQGPKSGSVVEIFRCEGRDVEGQ